MQPTDDVHLGRARLERLHAAGVRAAVHLDGTLKGLLPKLAATGIDAIEAITPQPVGDLSLEEQYRRDRERLNSERDSKIAKIRRG